MGEEGLTGEAGGEGAHSYSDAELFQQLFGDSNPFGDVGGMFGESSSDGTTSSMGGEPGGSFTDGEEPMEFGGSNIFGSVGGFGGRSRTRQDPPIDCKLDVSLEELNPGCTKKMKISQKVLLADGTSSEDKILTIDVKPGWKVQKSQFPHEGDQAVGRI